MQNRPFVLGVSLALLAALTAWAAPSSRGLLIVLNKTDNEAAIVDAEKYQTIEKLPTGQGPHEVAVSPDGKRAYIANYGAFRVLRQGDKPEMEPGNTLTVIDLVRVEVQEYNPARIVPATARDPRKPQRSADLGNLRRGAGRGGAR